MRTRLVILMAAMAIIASGCFKVDFTIDVNDDGSVGELMRLVGSR